MKYRGHLSNTFFGNFSTTPDRILSKQQRNYMITSDFACDWFSSALLGKFQLELSLRQLSRYKYVYLLSFYPLL